MDSFFRMITFTLMFCWYGIPFHAFSDNGYAFTKTLFYWDIYVTCEETLKNIFMIIGNKFIN